MGGWVAGGGTTWPAERRQAVRAHWPVELKPNTHALQPPCPLCDRAVVPLEVLELGLVATNSFGGATVTYVHHLFLHRRLRGRGHPKQRQRNNQPRDTVSQMHRHATCERRGLRPRAGGKWKTPPNNKSQQAEPTHEVHLLVVLLHPEHVVAVLEHLPGCLHEVVQSSVSPQLLAEDERALQLGFDENLGKPHHRLEIGKYRENAVSLLRSNFPGKRTRPPFECTLGDASMRSTEDRADELRISRKPRTSVSQLPMHFAKLRICLVTLVSIGLNTSGINC